MDVCQRTGQSELMSLGLGEKTDTLEINGSRVAGRWSEDRTVRINVAWTWRKDMIDAASRPVKLVLLSLGQDSENCFTCKGQSENCFTWNRVRTVLLGQDRVRTVSLGKDRMRTVSLGTDKLRTVSLGTDKLRIVSLGTDSVRTVLVGKDRMRTV